jgi:hypothetical protein
MHIDGVNSRVGIGTTAPTKTFSVTGSSYFNGTFTLAAGAGFMYDSLRFAYSNGSSSNNIYSGGADGLNISNQADTEILMRVLNNGNVAIGGTNPDYGSFGAGERILGIRNVSARGRLQFQNTSTGTTGVSGTLAFFNGSTQLASIDVIADGATNKGRYVFNTNNGTSNDARMYILNNGNVGIGTGVPSTKLEVNGAGAANSIMTYPCAKFYGGGSGGINIGTDGTYAMIATDTSGADMQLLTRVAGVFYPRITITSGGTLRLNSQATYGSLTYEQTIQYATSPAGIWFGNSFNSNNNVGLQLRTSNDGTSVQAMTLTPQGNVGIGSSAPDYKFVSYTANNSSIAAAMISADFFGPIIGTAQSSSAYYAFKVVRSLTNPSVNAAGAVDLFTVRADGLVIIPSLVSTFTTAQGANMYVNPADGAISRSTSSIKYKNSVTNYDKGLSIVNQLRPVYYKGNNDGDTLFAGLIAEEIHDLGLTEFVQYAEDGTPDALAYQNMIALAFKAIQEQQAQIEELKKEREILKNK